MSIIYIALGSNLGDSPRIILQAAKDIQIALDNPLKAFSSLHSSEPLVLETEDPKDMPRYTNAALSIESLKKPVEILDILQNIERQHGRLRELESKRWQARVLDLDIIAIDDCIIELPRLKVPHPEMHKRSFVLQPLSEIAPDWRHPLLGLDVRELLKHLSYTVLKN